MKQLFDQFDDPTRRSFMSYAAKSLLGVSVMPTMSGLVFGADTPSPSQKYPGGGTAKNVIYLFMEGAMSHLDTFDVKPKSQGSGTTQEVSTAVPGIKIGEHFQNLPALMKDVAVIRSMHTATGAHRPGRYLMRTSYEEIASIRHPSMGPWAQSYFGKRNKTLPDSVVIRGGSQHPSAGFMETRFSPLPIANAAEGLQNSDSPEYLKDRDFNTRMKLIDSFDAGFRKKYDHKEVRAYTDFYKETVALLKSSDLETFDINQEPEEVRKAYGEHRFGQGALLARRLIESNVRFVEVVSGGWDDHNNIYDDDKLPQRVNQLDQTLSALIKDLKSKGLFDETLIVLATEFGRTPKISDRAGRDHHPAAFSCALAGAGIKGGQVVGKTDDQGATVDDEGQVPSDLNATIAHKMGIDIDAEIYSPAGRPFKVAHDGVPIKKVL